MSASLTERQLSMGTSNNSSGYRRNQSARMGDEGHHHGSESPCTRHIQRWTKSVLGCVRGQDQYGQGIVLNYQDDDTFKTVPGGILSVIFKILFYSYVILKWNAMSYKKDWNITIQELVSHHSLLEYGHQFSKPMYKNISMGIQIMPSRPK